MNVLCVLTTAYPTLCSSERCFCLSCVVVNAICVQGHELTVNEDEIIPRPEEERITQAEKNERISSQLKVCLF